MTGFLTNARTAPHRSRHTHVLNKAKTPLNESVSVGNLRLNTVANNLNRRIEQTNTINLLAMACVKLILQEVILNRSFDQFGYGKNR